MAGQQPPTAKRDLKNMWLCIVCLWWSDTQRVPLRSAPQSSVPAFSSRVFASRGEAIAMFPSLSHRSISAVVPLPIAQPLHHTVILGVRPLRPSPPAPGCGPPWRGDGAVSVSGLTRGRRQSAEREPLGTETWSGVVCMESGLSGLCIPGTEPHLHPAW